MTPVASETQTLAAAMTEIARLRAQVSYLRQAIHDAHHDGLSTSLARLLGIVVAEWEIGEDLLFSRKRTSWIVEPRQVVMWVAAQHLHHRLSRIAEALQRDHSTVLHGVRAVTARIGTDPAFAARVQRVVVAFNTRAIPEVQ